jgi:hypothetical protein
LLLFPRGGRGLTVAPGLKTGSAMIVRGSYQIRSESSTLTPLPSATPVATTSAEPSITVQSTPANTTKTTELLQ